MTAALPGAVHLHQAAEATWPPARLWQDGPWTLREGLGGGKRVSAATAHAEAAPSDLAAAEAAMRAIGQRPLFMLREGQGALDGMLAEAGYGVLDPSSVYAIALDDLDLPAPAPTASFAIWEPLAIQREIWAAGGIGPARVAVMERAAHPKAALLGRLDGRAVGAGYVALSHGTAMVHALDVLPAFRRRGAARTLMAEAAIWARRQGAGVMAVICTDQNAAARALYGAMGMRKVDGYHYRQHPGAQG